LWRKLEDRLLLDLFGKVLLYGLLVNILKLLGVLAVQDYRIFVSELGLRHRLLKELIKHIVAMCF
jgi:hypothetical protein